MSQSCEILAHLKSGRSITQLECLNLYNCMRLAARIKDLRSQGYAIETKMISRGPKLWASYSLNLATPDSYKVQRVMEMSA